MDATLDLWTFVLFLSPILPDFIARDRIHCYRIVSFPVLRDGVLGVQVPRRGQHY